MRGHIISACCALFVASTIMSGDQYSRERGDIGKPSAEQMPVEEMVHMSSRFSNSPPNSRHCVELAYETEGFDLDKGRIHETEYPPGEFPQEVEFYFAYNADTDVHIRLFQMPMTWIIFLNDAPYDDVTCQALLGHDFVAGLVDETLEPEDTILVLSAEGNFYKIGEAAENEDLAVSFCYEQMDCAP